jgi:site-specific recombinase XerD
MFLAFVQKPLQHVNLLDVQEYQDSLQGKPATRNRRMATVKSLLSFASDAGYCNFNVGKMVELDDVPSGLAQRILPEEAVMRMIWKEPNTRNRAILHLLYHCGLRVSELTTLEWPALIPRDKGMGQITVIGKRNKERHILIEPAMWGELMALKAQATGPEVFTSQKYHKDGSKKLGRAQVWAIVHRAAVRAGIEVNFSPHWFRHAHASHSLDRGAPISLVQATLGHESVATTSRYLHARPNESSSHYLAM